MPSLPPQMVEILEIKMTGLEKATFAIKMVSELLVRQEKILAIKFIRMLYSETLRNAKDFVDSLEACHK